MTPGYKTTEFWLTLLAMIVCTLLAAGVFPADGQVAKILGVVGVVLAKLGYTASRTSVKKANAADVEVKANIGTPSPVVVVEPASARDVQAGRTTVFAMLALVVAAVPIALISQSCSQATRAAIAGKVIDCTTGAASSAVKQFAPALDALLVRSTLADGTVDRASLKDATKDFAADLGGCVLADVVARALKPKPTDPNAPKASPVDANPDDLRKAFDEIRASELGGATYTTKAGAL